MFTVRFDLETYTGRDGLTAAGDCGQIHLESDGSGTLGLLSLINGEEKMDRADSLGPSVRGSKSIETLVF